MVTMRRQHDAAFKAKVAFDAAKGEKTLTQIAGEFSVHPNQIRLWRKHLMEQLPELFSRRRPQQEKALEERDLLERVPDDGGYAMRMPRFLPRFGIK
jgi:putative transposase